MVSISSTTLTPVDSVAISNNVTGANGYAKLGLTLWSAVPGLTPGFVIKETNGTGVAHILDDPRNTTNSLAVYVDSAFSTGLIGSMSVIAAGLWYVDVPDGVNLTRYLDNQEATSTLFNDILQTFKDVIFNDWMDTSRRQENIRDPLLIDDDQLDNQIKTRGFFLDTAILPAEYKRRLLVELLNFYEISGSDYYIYFLGYVTNATFNVTYLWTNDYKTFVPYSNSLNSTYYPTPHVQLYYSFSDQSVDQAYIIKAFYAVAPIELVLDSIAGDVPANPATITVNSDLVMRKIITLDGH